MFRMKNVISLIKRKVYSNKPSKFQNTLNAAFGKYLLVTNTVTSGVLMLTGDLIEQEIEYQQNKIPERYDGKRLLRMFVVGFVQGPFQHWFYLYLDKILPKRNVQSVVKKILLDQFIMSPVSIVSLFYLAGLMENKTRLECRRELKQKFLGIYMVDWLFWPPTQFLNFYLFPVKYQVLFINFTTAIYNIFISYIKHEDDIAISIVRK